MTTFENQISPSSYLTYEQFKLNIEDKNLIRWVDRFLHKYALSCSYREIEVQEKNRFFSQYSTLFGVVLAYQTFYDIAELNFKNGTLSIKPSLYVGSNDLLHEAIVKNERLCKYLIKSANKSDYALDSLYDSINLKTKNVVVFARFIASSFLNQDFTANNLGISKAIEKESMLSLKNYLNAISNNLFATFVDSIKKQDFKE